MNDLTKGSPLKVILKFAIPLYIGQLFQLLYSLVDTRIIGMALGENSLAAVGATTAISDLLIEFLNGIVCGFGIIIATFFGAQNEKSLKRAIGNSVVLSVIVTVVISVLCIVLLPFILAYMNVSGDLYREAFSYIQIIIAGLIAMTLYNICAAILRAIGDSFTPLVFLIISNVLNILLDYTLVMRFQKGVAGAAVATVSSQAISAILCFFYMCKKYKQITVHKEDLRLDKEMAKQLIPSGLSMGFMLSFVLIGSLVLQMSINALGTNIIVAHTGARKITMIFLIPFFVLGTALATYCGQNLGAKQYERIKKGIRNTILAIIVWCLFAIVTVFTISPYLISLVTASKEPEIIEMAVLYLKVNSVFYILPAIICITRNSMQGFGDTRTPLISSMIELIGKVLIAYLLVPHISYWGVIVSEPIVWTVMVIPLVTGLKRLHL